MTESKRYFEVKFSKWMTKLTMHMRIKNPRIWVRNCKFRTVGDVILKASLPKEYVKRKIQLNDIASGLYHYEIHFLDGDKQFGKLSILK